MPSAIPFNPKPSGPKLPSPKPPRYRAINPRGLALLALALAALPGVATAHTSYLLPSLFTADTQTVVTVQAAFAERFFHPEVPVDAADFQVIGPDGTAAAPLSVTPLRQMVVVEGALGAPGTYRFTTGVRLGRIGKSALIDGQWRPFSGDAPAGATRIRSSQTETVADVYVTKRMPTRAPVDVPIGRLRLQPVSHPGDLALGQPFVVTVLFDGQPLAGQALVLDRGGADYEEAIEHRTITTDAQGRAAIGFKRPGIYVLMTRHQADAPPGAATAERSYTTSLTFEVAE